MSDSELLHRLPATGPQPVPTALTRPFWEGCNAGELRFQRCNACGAANFEPGPACRPCGSSDLSWAAGSGRGRLYSWTVVRRPQTPDFETPYACGIVTLEEGYRMLATVADCLVEDLAEGLPLVADFQQTQGEWALPFFRPVGSR